MPITITLAGPIPHRNGIDLTPSQVGDAINCIHQLKYSQCFGTRSKSEMCVENQFRLDMQGYVKPRDGQPARNNLQLQIAAFTVAHADVSQSVMTDDPMNQVGVLRKVKRALRESLRSRLSAYVTGNID